MRELLRPGGGATARAGAVYEYQLGHDVLSSSVSNQTIY